MIEYSVYRHFSDLSEIAAAWDDLKKREVMFVPSFSEVWSQLEGSAIDYRVLVARESSSIVAMACFLNRKSKKTYSIGERNLFSLPMRETVLVGSSMLGQVDERVATAFLTMAIAEWGFDLLSLGEVVVESPLHQAAIDLGGGSVATRVGRTNSIRWLIKLPESFDDYLRSLSSVSRNSVTRKMKKLERGGSCELRVIHRAEQIDEFLRDGEKISRTTYQWSVGQRLCDDEVTRDRFKRLAEREALRCYFLYIEGQPVAFLRGELSDRHFHYETPGFDPQFEKLSPGTVLLMWAIRDLIEKKECDVFDFGVGGDDSGYKSHFGNTSINCISLQIGRWNRPYSLLLVILQESLSFAKNVASAGLGSGRLRQRLRKAIRQSDPCVGAPMALI